MKMNKQTNKSSQKEGWVLPGINTPWPLGPSLAQDRSNHHPANAVFNSVEGGPRAFEPVGARNPEKMREVFQTLRHKELSGNT